MKRKLRNNQLGMVSILVTMIMMFVMTLIVLGFAENTRRNQRESLDSQLGMQAYYAAETGVNDIASGLAAGAGDINHTDCSTFTYGGKPLPRALSTDVANTCLMVDTTPTSMEVDSIAASAESVVWDVKNADGDTFNTLKFSWQKDTSSGGACNSNVGTYPTYPNWSCDWALLRVDVLRADVGSTDAAVLASRTATLYLQPHQSSSQPVTLNGFGGPVTAYRGSCVVGSSCSVTVTLGGGAQTNEYYVRMSALYADAKKVTLTCTDIAGTCKFKDGQAVVDSTGRAQDQLKRIRVRIPLTESPTTNPINAVQSAGSTCKDILIPGSDYQIGQCQGIWPS
jgi:Tfp pilus assembly protein PilX